MYRLAGASSRSEAVLQRGLLQPTIQCRNFHASRWALDEKKPSKEEDPVNFRLSLYQSTFDRIQREKADSDRFAKLRRESDRDWLGVTVSLVLRMSLCCCEGKGANQCAVAGAIAGGAYYLGKSAPKELPAESTTPLALAQPPQLDTRASTLQAAWVDFCQIVGKENVSTSDDDCKSHSGSEWSSYTTKPSEVPFAILYPASTEEVSKIMKVCHKRKIPVTALSGGTSLEGHFAPTRGGVCIDMGRMDKILDFHPKDLDITVQPALGWEDLNEHLAEHNMFFPPDPGPGAKIGGMIGTGCSGTNAFRFGTMREWVVSLTVVLADGTVIKTRRRPRKSSAGYNLTQMFIGSEGTLGIVTEAILKVTILPQNQSVGIATFPSIHHAAECVSKVVGTGIPLNGMEILDDVQMRCINESGSTTRKWDEAATLFFKFAGTENGVKDQIAVVRKLAKEAKNLNFQFAKNEDEAIELWSARKEALWSVMAKRREGDHVWTTDVAVPISHLPDIIQETKDELVKSGLLGGIVGHVGDGNFHTILLYNDAEQKTAENVVHFMVDRAIELEGTVTGEHGVGLKKRDSLVDELGEDTINAMRKVSSHVGIRYTHANILSSSNKHTTPTACSTATRFSVWRPINHDNRIIVSECGDQYSWLRTSLRHHIRLIAGKGTDSLWSATEYRT